MKIKSLKTYLENLTEDTVPDAQSKDANNQAAAALIAQNKNPSQKKKAEDAKKALKPNDSVATVGGDVGVNGEAPTVVSKSGTETVIKTKTGTKRVPDSEIVVPMSEEYDYSKIKFPTI